MSRPTIRVTGTAGSVADRLGHRLVIGVGLLVFAVAYAGLGLTERRMRARSLPPVAHDVPVALVSPSPR